MSGGGAEDRYRKLKRCPGCGAMLGPKVPGWRGIWCSRLCGMLPVPEPTFDPEDDFLPNPIVDFDGAGYDPERDRDRLSNDCERIRHRMWDSWWHTIYELTDDTGIPHQSVSAYIRHFRKRKGGSYVTLGRNVSGGLFEYRLIRPDHARHLVGPIR